MLESLGALERHCFPYLTLLGEPPEGVECPPREVEWTNMAGMERTVKCLPLPTNATEQSSLHKLSVATRKPSEERGEVGIEAEFRFERPILAKLKKVELATLKTKFDPKQVVLIETDVACSGKADHKGLGGRGVIDVWTAARHF
jgi:hypothetical protein